jgi:dTDP-4-amino-4,6-dideoxygalactose transaminase
MSGYQIAFTGLKRQYNNLREEILDVTDKVLTSGCLMDGRYTEQFERWLANKNRTRYALTCHSGTQALEIIADYYKQRYPIQPPKILVPSLTFPASANAFIRSGWDVEFIDTDAYGILDIDKIDIQGSHHAVLGVGLYGAPLDRFTRKYIGRTVIEDAAQHWLSNGGQRVASIAAISFDPMKNLGNYGNGGAVVSDDVEFINYAKGWHNNGKNTNHAEVGTNSRMSEVDCAQLIVKAAYIDEWQQRRWKIAHHWIRKFADSPVRCLVTQDTLDRHALHKFVIDIDHRDEVQKKLAQCGIETKIHYQHPLHELPAYQQYKGPTIISAASSLSRRCLSLPIYPELTDAEVEYISSSVLDCVS